MTKQVTDYTDSVGGGATTRRRVAVNTAVERTLLTTQNPSELSNHGTESVLKSTDAEDVWTQNQQMLLEARLKQYPKGTDKRWEKIAEHIPGKSKVIHKKNNHTA